MPIPNLANLVGLYGKTIVANVTSTSQPILTNNTSTTNATIKVTSIYAVAGQSPSNALLTIQFYSNYTYYLANIFNKVLVKSNVITPVNTRLEPFYLNHGDELRAFSNANCNVFITYEFATTDAFIIDNTTNLRPVTNIVNCSSVTNQGDSLLLTASGNLLINPKLISSNPNVTYKVNNLIARNSGSGSLDLGIYYYSNVSNTTTLFYGNTITGNNRIDIITQDRYLYVEQGDQLTYTFPTIAEPDYPNVWILLKGDAAEGSKSIPDLGPYNRVVNVAGANANVSASIRKFGNGSIRMHGPDGTANIWMPGFPIIPAAPNGAFTLEAWVYLLSSGRHCLLGDPNGNAYSTGWGAGIWDTNGPYGGDSVTKGLCWILSPVNGYGGNMVYSGQYPNLNQWTHVAIVRTSSGNWLFFMDGVLGTTYNTNSETHPFSQFPTNNGPTGSLQILLRLGEFNGILSGGNSSSMPAGFNGYIDDYRLTVGTARYTTNFVPPVATISTSTLVSNDNTLNLTIDYSTISEGRLNA